MAEALFAVWESRQNEPHGQIDWQHVGKKQGGIAYESKNENAQAAEYAARPCDGGGAAPGHGPGGVCLQRRRYCRYNGKRGIEGRPRRLRYLC